MSGESRADDRPPVHRRASTPASLALVTGTVTILLGVGLGLWGLSWLGIDAGRATGLLVLAAFAMMAIAVPLAVFGVVVCWIGWRGRRRDWVRGPAIASGAGLGVTLAVLVFLVSAMTGDGGFGYWLGLLPLTGAVLGWRWAVSLRRHHPELARSEGSDPGDEWREVAGVSIERPGRAGLAAGLGGAVVGLSLAFVSPLLGGAIFWVCLAGAVAAPVWFWVARPAYRRYRGE